MYGVKPPGVLVRSKAFLIIDKPAGLPVHAGRAGGPSVEDFWPLWRQGRVGPWLAHRLDQDTAGCLLVALKKSFLLQAQAAFAAGEVEKTYWAVLRGVPGARQGVVDAALAKQSYGKAWKMVPDAAGQAAITQWRVLGDDGARALVEFRPQTGRTHQIRAHAAYLRHPVLGDAIYGGGPGALHLLARGLSLPGLAAAEAPVPVHMRAAVEACAGTL